MRKKREKEVKAFYKDQKKKRHDFMVLQKNKSPAKVCGARVGKVTIYVRKGETWAKRKEEKGYSIWMKRSHFLVTSSGIDVRQLQGLKYRNVFSWIAIGYSP